MMIDDAKNKLDGSTDDDSTGRQASAGEPAHRDGGDSPASGSCKPAAAAVDVQGYIGRQLRAVYDDVAKQPVPERFLALMRQLEQSEK